MATDIHVYAQICRRRANGDTLFGEHKLMQRGNTVDKFTRVFRIDLERQMKQRLLHRCYHIIFGDSETRLHVSMDRHTTDLLMLRVAAESERMRRTKLYLHLRKIPVRMVLEVSFHRREQREMEAALRESMEVSDAFRAVPASQAAIDALEKTELHEVLDSGDDVCVICEDEISPDEEITRMSCKHIFHHECIVQWLSVSNLCLLCRFSMPIRSGDCD